MDCVLSNIKLQQLMKMGITHKTSSFSWMVSLFLALYLVPLMGVNGAPAALSQDQSDAIAKLWMGVDALASSEIKVKVYALVLLTSLAQSAPYKENNLMEWAEAVDSIGLMPQDPTQASKVETRASVLFPKLMNIYTTQLMYFMNHKSDEFKRYRFDRDQMPINKDLVFLFPKEPLSNCLSCSKTDDDDWQPTNFEDQKRSYGWIMDRFIRAMKTRMPPNQPATKPNEDFRARRRVELLVTVFARYQDIEAAYSKEIQMENLRPIFTYISKGWTCRGLLDKTWDRLPMGKFGIAIALGYSVYKWMPWVCGKMACPNCTDASNQTMAPTGLPYIPHKPSLWPWSDAAWWAVVGGLITLGLLCVIYPLFLCYKRFFGGDSPLMDIEQGSKKGNEMGDSTDSTDLTSRVSFKEGSWDRWPVTGPPTDRRESSRSTTASSNTSESLLVAEKRLKQLCQEAKDLRAKSAAPGQTIKYINAAMSRSWLAFDTLTGGLTSGLKGVPTTTPTTSADTTEGRVQLSRPVAIDLFIILTINVCSLLGLSLKRDADAMISFLVEHLRVAPGALLNKDNYKHILSKYGKRLDDFYSKSSKEASKSFVIQDIELPAVIAIMLAGEFGYSGLGETTKPQSEKGSTKQEPVRLQVKKLGASGRYPFCLTFKPLKDMFLQHFEPGYVATKAGKGSLVTFHKLMTDWARALMRAIFLATVWRRFYAILGYAIREEDRYKNLEIAVISLAFDMGELK